MLHGVKAIFPSSSCDEVAKYKVEVEMSGSSWTSRTTVADSHPTLFYKILLITQAIKDLDIDENRVRNYQKMAMCNYIYCGTFQ